VEREATPEPLMRLSIHLHAAGLSLSDTVSVLEQFGFANHFRNATHRRKLAANARLRMESANLNNAPLRSGLPYSDA